MIPFISQHIDFISYRSIALSELEFEYKKTYGHNIPLTRMGLDTMEDLVGVSLQSWVRLTDGVQGSMVVTVDRGFIRTMASNVRKLMVEQETGAMDFEEFVNIMATRYVMYLTLLLHNTLIQDHISYSILFISQLSSPNSESQILKSDFGCQ